MRARIQTQPGLFFFYAVAFGGLQYLFSDPSVPGAAVRGIVFAILMSLWNARRLRRSQRPGGEPNA